MEYHSNNTKGGGAVQFRALTSIHPKVFYKMLSCYSRDVFGKTSIITADETIIRFISTELHNIVGGVVSVTEVIEGGGGLLGARGRNGGCVSVVVVFIGEVISNRVIHCHNIVRVQESGGVWMYAIICLHGK